MVKDDETVAKTTTAPAADRRVPTRHVLVLAALAIFVTGLNAAKPLTVDDTVYYYFAVHIAEHPLDPYGFLINGEQEANTILAPPGFLYWWAFALRCLGDDPVVWKLSLLPINGLLMWLLYGLARRFAAGRELPYVCFTALSPVVLPCVNLMLDIPVLTLSLAAILIFMRACDRDSLSTAVFAGLIAGVAAQTKYTAFIVPAVLVVYGWLFGRRRLALIAAVLPAILFIAWELWIARRYGHSHFWLGFTQFRAPLLNKLKMIQPFFGYLGSASTALLPLALAAVGWSRRRVLIVVGIVAAVFAILAFAPDVVVHTARDLVIAPDGPTIASVLFGVLGIVITATVIEAARRLVLKSSTQGAEQATDYFLACWLLLEAAGCFGLNPYFATRRLVGVVTVAALVLFRLEARTVPLRASASWTIVGLNAVLGLLLFTADANEYYGQKALAVELADDLRREAPTATPYFFGDSAFGFYGERAGLIRFALGRSTAVTGDLILVRHGLREQFETLPIYSRCEWQETRTWIPYLPLQSKYQTGSSAVARLDGPSAWVDVYRVR